MKRFTFASMWAAATVCCWLAQAQTDKPTPDALRERAGRLEEKATDLKAAGRHDDALRAMTEARELSAQAKRIEQGAGPVRPQAHAQELKAQHARVAAEMKELRAAGKEAEARELEQKLRRVERELDALRDRPAPRPEARREERPEMLPEQAEFQRRMNHLQAAIENLHAGGFHEIAERLSQERENMRRQSTFDRPGPGPIAEIRRLRIELQELRQAMKELDRRMTRLHEPPADQPQRRNPGEGRRGPITGEPRPEAREELPSR
jgi:DNA repair exonuclease SbcCD ATPase subunit